MTSEVRRKTRSIIARLGYAENPHLPLLDEVEFVRDGRAVADRMCCLNGVVAAAYGADRSRVLEWIEAEGQRGTLSAEEAEFLSAKPSLPEDRSMQWTVESLWALAWCGSLHDALDFGVECGEELAGLMPTILEGESSTTLRQSVRVRPSAELQEMLDIAYCAHWSIRDAQLKGQPAPGKTTPLIVVKRRWALEWMLEDVVWDEVVLDT